MLEGKVFVSGGAGFLARALYRRAEAEGWPASFTAFSRDDAKHARLNRQFPNVRCIRGDVAGDETELANAMYGHDIVIHAAAAKYVDLAELNSFETVRQNVTGSANVIRAAVRAGVALCIGVSTDKACEPVNVYGLTKAVMERLFFEASRWPMSKTRFNLVRYGNVIGSTGSVFTKFREAIEAGQSLTLTNPEMTRFYLTADEAVDILIDAAGLPEEIASEGCLIPSWLRSMSTFDLARAATGFANPPYVVAGQRPGEKVHESLLSVSELPRTEVVSSKNHRYFLLHAPGVLAGHGSSALCAVDSASAGRYGAEDMARAVADAETI